MRIKKPKAPVIPELAIEAHILRWLTLKRILAWKNKSVGIFDAKKQIFRKSRNPYAINGVSDILGAYSTRLLAIEVKSAKGTVSLDQHGYLLKVLQAGGIAFVARSIEDVEKILSLLTYDQMYAACLANVMSQKITKPKARK